MAYYEDITIMPNNFLKCILCDKVMENSNHFIETHMDDRKHKEHYMKRLMSRNSLFIKDTKVICQLCIHDVEISAITHHVEGSHHCKILTSIKEIIEKDGNFTQISDDSSCIYCCICNSQMDFTTETVKSHTKSTKHLRAKAMVLQPLNGIFSVEDHDEYLWCKVCQRFFDNYVELILQHVKEAEHSKTMSKISRLIDGQNITIKKYLQSLSEDKAFCKLCSIVVPCNVDNLQRHINGKKHENSRNK